MEQNQAFHQKHGESAPEEPFIKDSYDIHILQASLDFHLKPFQIPRLRAAIAEAVGVENDIFHNHSSNGDCLFRYPQIQYRVYKGKATIYGINKGAISLRKFLLQNTQMRFGQEMIPIRIFAMQEFEEKVQFLREDNRYIISDYIPFNQENYEKWKNLDSMIERLQLMEKILRNHLLVFTNSLELAIPQDFGVRIVDIHEKKLVKAHGIQRLAFKLIFKTNIQLPHHIALGRAVAFGFGVLRKYI